jgi:hypothetical protein
MGEQMPKTVTACHAEIIRLQATISDLEGEKEKLMLELGSADIFGAVERLLDECERVGPLRYDLVQSDRASAAIVALHDLCGRNA